jgi:mannan endo-1,4-beta-mannosidase
MKKFYQLVLCVFLWSTTQFCVAQIPIDGKATAATKALCFNLKNNTAKGILFGQQDALMYGVGWYGDDDQSDVRRVTGSHPVVFGWDLEHVANQNKEQQRIQTAAKIKRLCVQVYEMGGINTFSWHVQNFVTGKNFYDTTQCVAAILPGGAKHQAYLASLDQIAAFFKDLKTTKAVPIPIIFRPFHEHTGNWFWWGKASCTVAEYKQLWRFTINYLKDRKKLHNILYAYSPDRISGNFDNYLERYPGDDFVDVLGFDNYYEFKDIKDSASTQVAVKSLAQIANYAKLHHKIVALTETGQDKLPQAAWFTTIFNQIQANPAASEIAYLMVWRNANTGHFFAPYPGHASAADFKIFFDHPKTIFLKDLDFSLYRLKGKRKD